MSSELMCGLCRPDGFWEANVRERHALIERIADAGFTHTYVADHVSFRNGSGSDGFVEVAAMSQMHETLKVMIGVYLLPLRHPLPIARQLATMDVVAEGRLIFGIGVGGEDRHEIEVCGVDPASRGKRTNESLAIIRELMAGGTVNRSGGFFDLEDARIRPTPANPAPIIVGGRSNAALHRAGRHGDGWIGVWCSARRYEEAVGIVQQTAAEAGRENVTWQHGYQPWVGVGDTTAEARARVANAMESFYKVPFEKFERYVPYGTPQEIADALFPYVRAGCRIMNLKVVAADANEEITAGTEIQRCLQRLAVA